jgi:hypothetical protein
MFGSILTVLVRGIRYFLIGLNCTVHLDFNGFRFGNFKVKIILKALMASDAPEAFLKKP